MGNNYIVHPKLTEHCKSIVIEKKMLLSKLLETMKYIIQTINVLILIKKKVTWNCLILFHVIKLPYKREAKWYGAQGFSNGHS